MEYSSKIGRAYLTFPEGFVLSDVEQKRAVSFKVSFCILCLSAARSYLIFTQKPCLVCLLDMQTYYLLKLIGMCQKLKYVRSRSQCDYSCRRHFSMLLMNINAPSQRNLLLNLKIIFAWTLNDISPKSIIVIAR